MTEEMLSMGYRLKIRYYLWLNGRKDRRVHQEILKNAVALGIVAAAVLALPIGETTISLLEFTV